MTSSLHSHEMINVCQFVQAKKFHNIIFVVRHSIVLRIIVDTIAHSFRTLWRAIKTHFFLVHFIWWEEFLTVFFFLWQFVLRLLFPRPFSQSLLFVHSIASLWFTYGISARAPNEDMNKQAMFMCMINRNSGAAFRLCVQCTRQISCEMEWAEKKKWERTNVEKMQKMKEIKIETASLRKCEQTNQTDDRTEKRKKKQNENVLQRAQQCFGREWKKRRDNFTHWHFDARHIVAYDEREENTMRNATNCAEECVSANASAHRTTTFSRSFVHRKPKCKHAIC